MLRGHTSWAPLKDITNINKIPSLEGPEKEEECIQGRYFAGGSCSFLLLCWLLWQRVWPGRLLQNEGEESTHGMSSDLDHLRDLVRIR